MDRPGDAATGADAHPDAAHHPDSHQPDAAPDAGCAISLGVTPHLDGVSDIGQYPAAQQLAPGAMMGADAAALAWDRDHLYITVTSDAFTSPYQPLHVYVETALALASPSSAQGKEYGGLVAELPFTPNFLVAARRVSDAGTGPYNGVWVPSLGWTTRADSIEPLVSADQRTLSMTVPWSAIGGCPHAMRLAVHVVHGVTGSEWKDLVPSTHTPWVAPGGGYYELDLTGSPAVAAWSLH
jgi:hypothetical protein